MRVIAMLLIGLFVGVLGTVTLMNVLRSETPYNHTVMNVLGEQMGALRGMRESKQCDVAESTRRLTLLHAIAGEVDGAFLPVGDDDAFRKHSAAMQARIADALAAPPADCAALVATSKSIGATCKACHEQFR